MERNAIAQALDSIASRVPRNEHTYTGADDLLYCSNCHTARQSRIEVFGEPKVVPCVCKCMYNSHTHRNRE